MNGAATSPNPTAGAGCTMASGRGPIQGGRGQGPGIGRRPTAGARWICVCRSNVPPGRLIVDRPVDRARSALDVHIPLDRPAPRARDRRVPLHVLAQDPPTLDDQDTMRIQIWRRDTNRFSRLLSSLRADDP